MTNKNPYENQDTVDIPDFVEDKTNSSSVDMSIFKMNDNYDDDDQYDDEDDYTDELEPRKPLKLNVPVIILGVLVAVLLIVSIVSIIKKSSADKQVEELTTQVETLKKKNKAYEDEISTLNAKVAELEAGKKDDKKDDKEDKKDDKDDDKEVSGDGNYVIVVDGGVNLRDEPSMDGEVVGSIGEGAFEGVGDPIEDEDGNIWIKTNEGSYACMKYQGQTFIKAK